MKGAQQKAFQVRGNNIHPWQPLTGSLGWLHLSLLFTLLTGMFKDGRASLRIFASGGRFSVIGSLIYDWMARGPWPT